LKIGAQAELFAARYLCQHGLKLIVQNYRCRFGEIDLIMQDGETLVFIEVRLRSSNKFGGAAASIDARKQRKLICTAQVYLSRLAYIPPCRFDAMLLKSPASPVQLATQQTILRDKDLLPEFQNSDIEWIKNAFSA
jgi:putative endonuclease